MDRIYIFVLFFEERKICICGGDYSVVQLFNYLYCFVLSSRWICNFGKQFGEKF